MIQRLFARIGYAVFFAFAVMASLALVLRAETALQVNLGTSATPSEPGFTNWTTGDNTAPAPTTINGIGLSLDVSVSDSGGGGGSYTLAFADFDIVDRTTDNFAGAPNPASFEFTANGTDDIWIRYTNTDPGGGAGNTTFVVVNGFQIDVVPPAGTVVVIK